MDFFAGRVLENPATSRLDDGFQNQAMNHEEHDKLWELLGKAREPKVSPFFASKVVRAVRAGDEAQPGFLAWLRRRWFVPLTAGACAAVIAILAFYRPSGERGDLVAASDPLEEIAAVATGAPEIPSLDSLLASEDHSIWLQADPSSLY